MSIERPHSKHNNRYSRQVIAKSPFDGCPTLIVHQYHVPRSYERAVRQVIAAYKSDVPFNKAVDQVFEADPKHLNRNKLAEHTLKAIANEY